MINEIFNQINKSNFAANGDSIDKLASYYTVIIYIFGAIFLSLSPFVAGFFECRVPAHYKPEWVNYATRLCYLNNSYYVPQDVTIDTHVIETGDAVQITYYQWIPYYLAVSSVIFMIPYVYWTSITKVAGIDLEFLITQASKFDADATKAKREDTIKALADYIDMYLDNQEPVPGSKSAMENLIEMFKCCSNQKGTLMGNNYFFSKLLYIAVILIQLFSLCKFLGFNLIAFAFNPGTFGTLLLRHSFDWRDQEQFPLVTYCYFSKRLEHDKVDELFIQCAMPNNIFNERFFTLLCYWLVAVLALSIYSTIKWFDAIFLNLRRTKYVKDLIKKTQEFPKENSDMEKERLNDFVSWYLQADGIFVFRMIGNNTSSVVASEILCKLWEHFNLNYEEERKHRRQRGKSKKSSRKNNDDELAPLSNLGDEDFTDSKNDKPQSSSHA